MKLVIAADHAGFALKEFLKGEPVFSSHDVTDQGAHNLESVDYPDFAQKLAHTILDGTADMGILLCGTGIGMSIAANRFKGIRAALCHDVTTAKLARLHNNANVLCLGARVMGTTTALEITEAFLNTSFEGGKHLVRTQKMDLDQ
jgi:ribose 5-phosphate isomerase B